MNVVLVLGRGVLELHPPGGEAVERRWEDLEVLADEARGVLADLKGGGASLLVVLLPPLQRYRLVDLPPLRRAEREAVIQRDAARHFPRLPGEGFVAVGEPVPGTGSVPVCAVEREPLDVLLSVVHDVGLRLGGIVPAEEAWADIAGSLDPAAPEGSGRYRVELDGIVTLLEVEDGRLRSLRRRPAGDLAESTSMDGEEEKDGEEARTSFFGAPSAPDLAELTGAASAMELCGRLRSLPRGTDLLPPELRRRRAERRQRVGVRLLAAAAAIAVLAGIVEWWGWEREMDVIAERRESIRSTVRSALETRNSLTRVGETLRSIADFEAEAPPWSLRMGTLAAALPEHAHLAALEGARDSLMLHVRSPDLPDVAERIAALDQVEGATLLAGGGDDEAGSVAGRIVVRFAAASAPALEREGEP